MFGTWTRLLKDFLFSTSETAISSTTLTIITNIFQIQTFICSLLFYVLNSMTFCGCPQGYLPPTKNGVEPKRPSRPINITPLVRLSTTVPNTIVVSWTSEIGRVMNANQFEIYFLMGLKLKTIIRMCFKYCVVHTELLHGSVPGPTAVLLSFATETTVKRH